MFYAPFCVCGPAYGMILPRTLLILCFFFVFFCLAEPVTDIIGGPELHINRGSTINLTCIVKFAPEPPPTVIWSHNREVSPQIPPRKPITKSQKPQRDHLTCARVYYIYLCLYLHSYSFIFMAVPKYTHIIQA